MGVRGIVGVCHEPFVDAEGAAWFEDLQVQESQHSVREKFGGRGSMSNHGNFRSTYTEDFGVHTSEAGRMDGGFDGVNCVEGVVCEGHLLWVNQVSISCSTSPRTPENY